MKVFRRGIHRSNDTTQKSQVTSLTADREFVGSDWFGYLLGNPKMPFRIRIRETEQLFDGAEAVNGKRLFEGLKIGERPSFSERPSFKALKNHGRKAKSVFGSAAIIFEMA